MPYDKVENLPSDNLEVSENEKIILNNLYPEKIDDLPPSPPVVSMLNLKPQPDFMTLENFEGQSVKETPPLAEESVPEETNSNKFQNSSYLKIVMLVTIFIFLNYPSVTNWINGLYPEYSVYIKIFVFALILVILNYFNFL